MFDFHFHVNADLSAMERTVSELQDKIEEIIATIEAEKAEVAEALAVLGEKVDVLTEAIAAETADKALVSDGLAEIKAGIEGIFTKTGVAYRPSPRKT